MILKSYLHIKIRHLVKIIPTTPTCFSLSRPSSGSFVLPYFEVANACMLNIYGAAAACVWLCRLCLCSFAGVCPVLTKLPEDGLDRLKHVGVVGIILTK